MTRCAVARSANYDESKANVFLKLPDPLVFKDGHPVKTANDWFKRSREIHDDFDREVLGRTPGLGSAVVWHIVSTRHEKYRGVDVVTKRLAGRVGPGMTLPDNEHRSAADSLKPRRARFP